MTKQTRIIINEDAAVNLTNFVNRVLKKFWILIPEASWVFAGQAGTAIAGLVGIKLLTHVLDPSEFGKLALANTIVALIGTNLFGPFGQGLMRYWSISRNLGNLDLFYSVANTFAKYICLTSLLTLIVFALILSIFKTFDWTILIALSLVIGAITGILGLRVSIFTAVRQRRRIAILTSSDTLFRPLFATFLVVLTIAKANVALVGYLLASFFILLITERLYSEIGSQTFPDHLRSDIRAPLFNSLRKEILSYSRPFLIWGIFGWIHMSCDRWSLQTFHGSEVVGAFVVVSLLASYPLNFGSGFLTTLFAPIAFQRAGDLIHDRAVDSGNRILAVMTGIYILGAGFITAFFAFFHRPLILFISNERFVQFSYLLPGLTTAWAFFFLGQVLTQFGLLLNKPQVYIMPKLVASLVAVTTAFYLSSRIGPSGVVWGLAIAGLIYAGWCTVVNLTLMPFFSKNRRYGE